MLPVVIGIMGIAITVALHAFTTSFLLVGLRWYARRRPDRHLGVTARPLILGITATVLASKHYLDIALYAVAYWFFENDSQLTDYESALYFSSITYTTLGYGDIVLTDGWRLMCGIQAMNGTLLFGWSTALLFFLVQKIWFAGISPETKIQFKQHAGEGLTPSVGSSKDGS